jgi:hypothetical protein
MFNNIYYSDLHIMLNELYYDTETWKKIMITEELRLFQRYAIQYLNQNYTFNDMKNWL